MFVDLGDQRAMAMEMVLAASEFGSDPTTARLRLQEAAEEFGRIQDQFSENTETLRVVVLPELNAATTATASLWEEFEPRVQTLLESEATSSASDEAREYIRTTGPLLSSLTAEMSSALRLQMETTRRRIWGFLMGAVVFNLLLAASGYLLIRRRIVDPLRKLEEAARTLRSGRLGARVESGAKNEIGLVERAFNDMAREIERLVASLEERRAFAESLITHAPAGVVVHRKGDVIFANPYFLSLIGISAIEEIAGKKFADLFRSADRDSQNFTVLDPSPERGDLPTALELQLWKKGEGTRTVEVVTVPIEHEGSEAAMTILQDITEREELAARMMQIDRVAALGTLLAGMGHEINNPLSFLTNNLEFSLQHLEQLREELQGIAGENDSGGWIEKFEAVEEALRESNLGSERIREIVSRLRSFSRVDDTPTRAIHLAGALESSIRMADGEIRHRAHLVRDFRPVPPVEANESQMGQVFLNLLINAAHAITEGNAEEDTITVSLFQLNDQVVVEISDTGSGIPKEVAPRIFDPFFTTKSPGQGTGLGLSICQKIIEAHGGLITFRSQEGEGTTFRVALPAVANFPSMDSTPHLIQANGGKRKLAIIDDDPMVCRGLQRLLESKNEVHVFTDARVFLKTIEEGEGYDVIFCDLMMPEMTGMELHDILSVRYPDILSRTIFMTGGAFTPHAERFLDTLESPLLFKPFDLNQILDLVARVEPRTT